MLNTNEIAVLADCSSWTVRQRLNVFGIAIRSKSEAFKLNYIKNPERTEEARSRMVERYEDPEERKKIGRATKRRYEDPEERRKHSAVMKKCFSNIEYRRFKIKQLSDYNKSFIGRKRRSELTKEYWKNPKHRKTLSERSKKMWEDDGYRERMVLLLSESATRQWECDRYKEAHSGENHFNWKGGISIEPYTIEFSEEFKEHIRILADRRCFLCGGVSTNGNRLDVHHIDYGKKHTIIENCVPLCNVCHISTNYNREEWEIILSCLWMDFLFSSRKIGI